MPHVPYLTLDGRTATFDPTECEYFPESRNPRHGLCLDLYRKPTGEWIIHGRYTKPLEPWETCAPFQQHPNQQTNTDRVARYFSDRGRSLPDSLVKDIAAARKAPEPKARNDAPPPITSRAKLKGPRNQAFAAYRLVKIAGQKQLDVARMLKVDQGTVSRWVREVTRWIEAGKVLPDSMRVSDSTPKVVTMDPNKLERGRRLRGRAHKDS
jgi:hypothetical protein